MTMSPTFRVSLLFLLKPLWKCPDRYIIGVSKVCQFDNIG